MKNFIIGLLLGIVATTAYFSYKYSSQAAKPAGSNDVNIGDSSIVKDTIKRIDTPVLRNNIKPQTVAAGYLRDSIVAFAKTLIGVPYLYGSTDPAKGFDCSGFINYVFNHFNITVPRSSYEFDHVGKKLPMNSCQQGDLLLFTGTNPQEKNIGHIGIVIDTSGGIPKFIHSSSGKAMGVTITSMESTYYQGRFVEAVDILPK